MKIFTWQTVFFFTQIKIILMFYMRLSQVSRRTDFDIQQMVAVVST